MFLSVTTTMLGCAPFGNGRMRMGYKEARAMLDREEKSLKEFEHTMGGRKVLDWMWQERLRRMRKERQAQGGKEEISIEDRVTALEKQVAKLSRRATAK